MSQQNQPAQQQQEKKWPKIAMIITAIGIPSGMWAVFTQWLLAHPAFAVCLTILAEVLVLIFGICAGVWGKLQADIINFFYFRFQEVFSFCRRTYIQHMIWHHRDFDIKGLSTQGPYTLELEKVFVELSIIPRPVHVKNKDPIQRIPEELFNKSQVIWDFLKIKNLSWQNFVIIGPPGSGKTTMLKHMVLTLSRRKDRKKQKAPDRLPVLIFLRKQGDKIVNNPDYSLSEAIQESLPLKKDSDEYPVTTRWFERQLRSGRCLVMLDGLDEVADLKTRKKVVIWVEKQMSLYFKNRFVVTSRPHGYETNPLRGVTVFRVLPFDNTQVERFVRSWYLSNEIMSTQKKDRGVEITAEEGANDLLERIRNTPALSELSVNPLLLTMIANVHRFRSTLPGRRVELYAEICEVFLGKRQQAKGIEDNLTPAQKQHVLQPLAYHLMAEKKREISLDNAVRIIEKILKQVSPVLSGNDFLQLIENSSGLVIERESGIWSFSHLTFQEYLASVHVRQARLEHDLLKHVGDSFWHETIRLYCAKNDATPIIKKCMEEEKVLSSALTLAIECEEEALTLESKIRSQLKTLLVKGIEDKNPERRRIVAEALLSIRLRKMVRLSETRYIDPGLITHAEYQLFIDEMRNQGKYRQPDHWLSYQFPAGEGNTPVCGVRSTDAVKFCLWLSRKYPGPWSYTLPDLEMVIKEADKSHTSYWCNSKEAKIPVISFVPKNTHLGEIVKHQIDEDLRIANDLDSVFTRSLTHDLDLVLDLARDFHLARASTLTYDFDLTRDIPRTNARDLVFSRIINPHLDLARVLDLARDFVLPFARDLGLIHALGLDRHILYDRARALKRAFMHDLDFKKIFHSHTPEQDFLRWYIRYIFFLVADILFMENKPIPWFKRLFLKNKVIDLIKLKKMQASGYIYFYIDLVILEARIQGKLPAFEGIRIMKELKR